MKKIFLLTILTISVNALFAQSFNIGIRGGLNESILDYKLYPGYSHSRLTGFNAGAFVDVGFGKISIEPGLFYTTKGEKNSYNDPATNTDASSYADTRKVTYNYLELPVNILYNISTLFGKIFIGGGPYIAYGLSGNLEINEINSNGGTATPYSSNYKIAFGGTLDNPKREDYGLGAIGGLRLKNGITLNLGYEHSVFNIYKSGDGSAKHDVISFSIGYSFL